MFRVVLEIKTLLSLSTSDTENKPACVWKRVSLDFRHCTLLLVTFMFVILEKGHILLFIPPNLIVMLELFIFKNFVTSTFSLKSLE